MYTTHGLLYTIVRGIIGDDLIVWAVAVSTGRPLRRHQQNERIMVQMRPDRFSRQTAVNIKSSHMY
jgi:hypothetical protein